MKKVFYFGLISIAIKYLAFCSPDDIQHPPLSNVVRHDFLLLDSIISTSSNMPPYTSSQVHNSISRNIFIEHDTSLKLLYYGKDTFQMYGSPTSFIKGSSPHFLSYDNDSISISRHIGGIGIQTWLILKGKRK